MTNSYEQITYLFHTLNQRRLFFICMADSENEGLLMRSNKIFGSLPI